MIEEYGWYDSPCATSTISPNLTADPLLPASASLTVPLTVGALAYLNARWRLPLDVNTIGSLTRARRRYANRLKANHVNIFYVLEEHAQNKKTADKIFLVYEGKTWTFAQTYDATLRYAGYLHTTHFITPGEIIAMDFMNCPQFVFLTLALWSLGAIPAYINYNLTGAPLIHCIKVSTARLLLVDPEVATKALSKETRSVLESSNFRNNAFPLQVAVLDIGLQSSLTYFPPYRAPDTARNGAESRGPCALIFTSGTTGLPKPAILAWERVQTGAMFCAMWQGLRGVTHKHPDRYFTAMPLYHSSAWILGFNMCLMYGATFVVSHKFSATNFWNEVRQSEATVIQYVGETLRYLLAAPVQKDERTNHKVRMAFGNGLRPDVWEKFQQRFNIPTIAEFYGATEGASSSWNFSRNSFSTGAIGTGGIISEFLIGSQQAIVKVDWETEKPFRSPQTGLCTRVPRGHPGELLYAVDPADIEAKYQGYFGNKTATESKIMRDVIKKGDAYFRTGDVVRWDKDGRLWFSDRIGDTFRWKSENVSTSEVSEVLGHHPKMVEANVYGVQIPGHEGRAGCAAVLLSEEPSEQLLESLATYCTNSLPRYAVPVFIRVVKEVQATGNNKQQKHVLRKEGVDPAQSGADRIFWLRPGASKYEVFGKREWDSLGRGQVKL